MPAPSQPRPTSAGAAFQERVIEVRATAEEIVISKETRVFEEIVVRKWVGDRVETVRETLREMGAEIEDSTQQRAPDKLPGR